MKYGTIYADPPWMERGGAAGSSGGLIDTTRS